MRIHISNIVFYNSSIDSVYNHLVTEVPNHLTNDEYHRLVAEYIKKTTGHVAKEYSIDYNMVRGDHPELKGSFTCLGNWYNLFHKESKIKLEEMLARINNKTDKNTALNEIANAKKNAESWVRYPNMDFLYEHANAQGDWDTTF